MDFCLWERAIRELCLLGPRLRLRLGEYVKEPHQHMEWLVSEDEREVYFVPDNAVVDEYDVYKIDQNQTGPMTRAGHIYRWREIAEGILPVQKYAWATLIDDTTVRLHCSR